MKAKVTRKCIGRREVRKGGKGKALVVYRVGDEIEVSDNELKNFGDRLEVFKQDTKDKPKTRTQAKTTDKGGAKKAEPKPAENAPDPEPADADKAEVSDSGDI